jgi:three-Cys-motif partner protein
MSKKQLQFDEIGYWSEVKLDIVREYAAAYSKILGARRNPAFHHIYIDGFAGAGIHISKSTGQFVRGSPLNALCVNPPFKDYYFIDIAETRAQALKEITGSRSDVHVLPGDCNKVLLQDVFPNVRYERYERALCLLDPYGLHLDWRVIEAAGKSQSIEVFLNFPVADMNRNVFWANPEAVSASDVDRMSRYWGDESWRQVAYKSVPGLFGDMEEKAGMDAIVDAFGQRLREKAGFKYVPEPIPMRNTRRAIVYYLYFAAHKPVAAKIVKHIFDKYRTRGG